MTREHRATRASVRASVNVALAVAVASLVAGCGGSVAPPSASTPALTPMPAGSYTSISFQPTISFTVPEGWVITADGPLYFSLQPAGNDLIGIHVFRDPKAASQDETCAASPEPGVGGSSSELAAWIGDRPGLVVGTPTMATVGGLRGVALDVALRADWAAACPFANGTPSVPLFNSPAIDHWVVVGNERLRLYLLDAPGGGTVVVDLDAFDGDQIEDLLARSGGIVRSMTFDTGDGAGSAAPSP